MNPILRSNRLFPLIAGVFLGGCGNTTVIDSPPATNSAPSGPKQKAFLDSREKNAATNVLIKSGLYEFTEEQAAEIRISDIMLAYDEYLPPCANPIMGQAILLGTVPISNKGFYTLSYRLDDQKASHVYYHTLSAHTRSSIWEHFIPSADTDDIAAGFSMTTRTTSDPTPVTDTLPGLAPVKRTPLTRSPE